MSTVTSEDRTAPAEGDASAPSRGFLYPERNDRPIIIRESLLSKIIIGLSCSSIVAVVMNFTGLKWLIVHLLALILSLFGADSYIVKPTEAAKQVAADALGKIKDEIKDHSPKGIGLASGISLGAKSQEQLKAEFEQRELERKRRADSEAKTLQARAGVIGFACDKTWSLEQLRIEVTAAEKRVKEEEAKKPYLARAATLGLVVEASSDLKTLKQRVEEEEQRVSVEQAKQPLVARARKINFTTDPDWDLKTLKEQVLRAEHAVAVDASYQADLRRWEDKMTEYNHQIEYGPNCACPFCGYQFGTNRTKGEFICPSCNELAFIKTARARFQAPPPPRKPEPPSSSPGLLGKFFK